MEFIFYLVLILLSTKVAGDLSVRLGQPAVLGKLLAGIVLGPAVLGWVHADAFISYFSEIGVLLLMFIAGLETDLDQLRKNWKASFAVAVGGIILPFIGGYGVAMTLGLSNTQSLFLGLLLCATSVSISVQTLKEMNQLNSREGTTILGAAVVDDVIVVVMLAVMMSLLGTEDISLGILLSKKILFFIVILVAGWFAVPWVMRILAPFRVSEAVMSGALIICFSFSYFAELMGVAGIIGAFAAGIAVSQTKFRHDVETKVEPIAYTLFVPVFFVSIGLNISFQGLGNQILFIVLVTVIAVLTKLVGGGIGARITGFGNRSSLAIGSGMISRGEVALIIAASGLESGLLPQNYFTSVVLVVILTTLITPPLLKIVFPKKAIAAEATE
ncbi:cation:proton antiporter [Paenibacillus nasutitermitis]|uniref:Sodium:proton antiporter n=1 Tax=Paenibacillus nasutitermitis TaxID=1652958 RepID=A0A917DSP4_9BACL|nr:cation:proton antiporter [Paenibacillus nasutitermitis]GGD63002.1 sodium:proton antiporter [Paenibacillus nasutitermitis]